jgi:hypothetical protein
MYSIEGCRVVLLCSRCSLLLHCCTLVLLVLLMMVGDHVDGTILQRAIGQHLADLLVQYPAAWHMMASQTICWHRISCSKQSATCDSVTCLGATAAVGVAGHDLVLLPAVTPAPVAPPPPAAALLLPAPHPAEDAAAELPATCVNISQADMSNRTQGSNQASEQGHEPHQSDQGPVYCCRCNEHTDSLKHAEGHLRQSSAPAAASCCLDMQVQRGHHEGRWRAVALHSHVGVHVLG